MVRMHENIVGIDAAIFMHPTTWKASGHVDDAKSSEEKGVVRPAGLEPATVGFEVRYSIQLSYGRTEGSHSDRTEANARD